MAHVSIQPKHHTHKTRAVKVKHAHARSHRKRHYALLVVAGAGVMVLLGMIVTYLNRSAINQAVASETIASMFGNQANGNKAEVTSTYGFTVAYNPKQYYVSAVDGSTGGLYVGDEVTAERAYDTLRFSEQTSGQQSSVNSIMVNYYARETGDDVARVEQQFVIDKLSGPSQVTKGESTTKVIHDVTFQRTEWSRKITAKSVELVVTFVSYAAVVNGHPFTVITYQGDKSAASADAFIDAMSFTKKTASLRQEPTAEVEAKHAVAVELLDTMLGTQPAMAASVAPSYTTAERISATYGPAVVKIYNILVADLSIDGKVLAPDYVTGGTGSGFIVSKDGYIGTNGHVVVNDAKDTIIYGAITAAYLGKSQLLEYLLNLTSLTKEDIYGATSEAEALKVMVRALYTIPDSHFSFDNKKENLLVGLGDQQIDAQELVTATKTGASYTETDTIKHVKLVNSDFEGMLLPAVMKEFKKSDVALLKIDSGASYPMVKIGSYDTLTQGENLNIVGFPGVADGDNGLVSKTVGSATLTTGKISALKKDSGGRNLIETDTVIGHGNSGGPAFDDDGNVIGLATYQSFSGEDKINYVRDIADFQKLADKESVQYSSLSDTQKEWNKAIELFYQAHYKSAIAHFNKVKELYPAHPKVVAMVASADKHIANGDNIDEFPVVPVAIGLGLAVLGVIVAIVFIVLHRRGHKAYVHGINSGQIQPMVSGMSPQVVAMPVPQLQAGGYGVSQQPVPVQPTVQQELTESPVYQDPLLSQSASGPVVSTPASFGDQSQSPAAFSQNVSHPTSSQQPLPPPDTPLQ